MPVSMRTADRITAIVLAALGLAMLVGGYTMDRLEIRNIHPSSIPGLVPMILGALMTLCATLLYRNAGTGDDTDLAGQGSVRRLVITAGLCVVYAIGLVGTLPFWMATAVFVALFTLIFSWPETTDPRTRFIALAASVGFGLVVAVAVSVLFRHGFLVRLP